MWGNTWVNTTYFSYTTVLTISNYTSGEVVPTTGDLAWSIPGMYAFSGYVYWYVPECTNYKAKQGSTYVTVNKATGSITSMSLSGTAKVGQTLTASVATNSGGTVTYKW